MSCDAILADGSSPPPANLLFCVDACLNPGTITATYDTLPNIVAATAGSYDFVKVGSPTPTAYGMTVNGGTQVMPRLFTFGNWMRWRNASALPPVTDFTWLSFGHHNLPPQNAGAIGSYFENFFNTGIMMVRWVATSGTDGNIALSQSGTTYTIPGSPVLDFPSRGGVGAAGSLDAWWVSVVRRQVVGGVSYWRWIFLQDLDAGAGPEVSTVSEWNESDSPTRTGPGEFQAEFNTDLWGWALGNGLGSSDREHGGCGIRLSACTDDEMAQLGLWGVSRFSSTAVETLRPLICTSGGSALPDQSGPLTEILSLWRTSMAARQIIPDFQWSAFYYDEILAAEIRFKLAKWPEHTETDPADPVVRLLQLFALVGHQASVKIDHVARETTIGTARLRSSLLSLGRIAGYTFSPPSPAVIDAVVGKLTGPVSASDVLLPARTRWSTEAGTASPAVSFEYDSDDDLLCTQDSGTFDVAESAPFALISSFSASLWGGTASAGDVLYVGHPDLQFDAVAIDAAGTQVLRGVWEYYDDQRIAAPATVEDLSGSIRLGIGSLHGARDVDAVGAEVVVTCLRTGISETVTTTLNGTTLVAVTADTLGQTSPSTNASDYTIQCFWPGLPNVSDGTEGSPGDASAREQLAVAGDVTWTLPQSADRRWVKTAPGTGAAEGYWIRLRVTEVTSGSAHTLEEPVEVAGRGWYIAPEALQGQVVREAVGSTDAGSARQSFALAREPFLSLVQVEVGVDVWEEVESFVDALADAVFRVEEDPDGTMRVKFGDGTRGKIPTASSSVYVTYRYGGAASGNVGPRTLRPRTTTPRFNGWYNPRAGSGWSVREGTTADSLELVRAAIPAYVRTGKRAVTPSDYETLARAFRTADGRQVAERVVALQNGAGPGTIKLVCVGPSNTVPTSGDLLELEAYFNGSTFGTQRVGGVSMANVVVVAVAFTGVSVDVTATVTVEQGYTLGVKAELESMLRARLQPLARKLLRDDDGNVVLSGEYAWKFGGRVPRSFLQAEIITSTNRITDLEIAAPAADVTLGASELPIPGTMTIAVVEAT